VVAPDLPGYHTSDKAPRVRDYRPSVLAEDVADLIVALDAGSAAVAGRDWGGALRAAINYYRAALRANPLAHAACVAWTPRP
jgi:pimeloyl-ACP methyl ester carboxylesterase